VALRFGAATAVTLLVEHFVTLDILRLRAGLGPYWTWDEARFAVAKALPVGAAMALVVGREGRRRWPFTCLPEAALLAVVCHVLVVVWIVSVRLGRLPVLPPMLLEDLAGEVPRLAGMCLALLLAPRHLSTPVVGMSFAIPLALGDAMHGVALGSSGIALPCLIRLVVLAALLPVFGRMLSRVGSPRSRD